MNLTKLMITALLFTSTQIHAADKKGKMLVNAKAMAVENIDEKIGLLNDLKSCINKASDRAALKECRNKAKTKRESLKESNQAKKAQMKEKRKQRKEERQKNKK